MSYRNPHEITPITMEQETRSESPTDSNRQEHSSKTSFLIEDILYRGHDTRSFKAPEQRRHEYEREPKPFFQVPSDIRPHMPGREGSYLQVAMGALGAYLHTPNTYKAIEAPYFLSQGKALGITKLFLYLYNFYPIFNPN